MLFTQRNTPGEESFIERKRAFIGKKFKNQRELIVQGKGLSIELSTAERL